jgi:TIR domain
MGDNRRQIFISYSRDERDLAHRLAAELRNSGAKPWLADDDLRPGSSFGDAIREALDRSDAFVLFIGTDASDWARFERSEVLKRAWTDQDAVILPVLVGDADPPGYLRDLVALRVNPAGQGMEQVVASLEHPRNRGVSRTYAGDKRLNDRLADIEQAAAEAEGFADEE